MDYYYNLKSELVIKAEVPPSPFSLSYPLPFHHWMMQQEALTRCQSLRIVLSRLQNGEKLCSPFSLSLSLSYFKYKNNNNK
jgi:hypothetical protein